MIERAQQPITALIVDDERDSRRLISLYLSEEEHITIVGEAYSARDAYEQILRLRPSLVFLDIHMPAGDGFSLLRMLTSITFEIIFVTSFDQYAIKAIKHNALDYLLKPIMKTELQQAVAKAVERIRDKESTQLRVKAMLAEHAQQSNPASKFTIHHGDYVRLIDVEDIMYIVADNRYVHFKLWDNTEHVLAKTLKAIADDLAAFPRFIRISKTELINVEAIITYGKGFNCLITMADHRTFEVSRRRKTEVLSKLGTLKI